jgi:hypothetical protein
MNSAHSQDSKIWYLLVTFSSQYISPTFPLILRKLLKDYNFLEDTQACGFHSYGGQIPVLH